MIRFDLPGFSGEESLQEISWDQWFKQFDENNLALMVQEETAGGQRSNFNKLVNRDTVEAASTARGAPARKRLAKRRTATAKKRPAARATRATKTRKAAARGKASKRAAKTSKRAAKTSGRRGATRKRTAKSASRSR